MINSFAPIKTLMDFNKKPRSKAGFVFFKVS